MELETILEELKAERWVVLAGSGISRPSGLPTGLELMDSLLGVCAPTPEVGRDLRALASPLGVRPRPLRFEGLLEVLERIVDDELRLLELFAGPRRNTSFDGGPPGTNHYAMIPLIQRGNNVVTTNFDILMEKAAEDLGISPLACHISENEWESFNVDGPSALLKIHGSLLSQPQRGGEWKWIPRDDPRSPVATLYDISRSRDSIRKREVVASLLARSPMLVVGYSASDDFDVSRWIEESGSDKAVVWIQHDSSMRPGKLCYYSGEQVARGATRADPGVIEIAHAWLRAGYASRKRAIENLHFFRGDTSHALQVAAKVLAGVDVAAVSPTLAVDIEAYVSDWADKFCAQSWAKWTVAGALLGYCSFFLKAITCLRSALDEAPDDNARFRVHVCMAENLTELPFPEQKLEAYEHAVKAWDLIRSVNPGEKWKWSAQLALANAALYRSRIAVSEDERQRFLTEALQNFDEVRQYAQGPAKARAATELYRLGRHRGRDPIVGLEEEIRQLQRRDLSVEALILHESARRGPWERARSIGDVEAAIEMMRRAVGLRQQLHNIRGLCASTNVLGNIWQRMWDWTRWERGREDEAVIRQAVFWHERSRQIGKEYGLLWDQGQAAIALSVLWLRWQHDVDKAWSYAEEAEQFRRTYSPADAVKLDLQLALLTFFFDELGASIRATREALVRVVAAYRTGAGDARQDRCVGAAEANIWICDRLIGADVEFKWPASLPRSVYWVRRLDEARRAVAEASGGTGEATWHRLLLDPLP